MNIRTLLVIVLCIALFVGCNANVSQEKNMQEQSDFVIDDSLSLCYYLNVEGYLPKEGFVPTADIAFQIAKSVLIRIYGKEQIESEKPFSVNLENGIWIIEGHLEAGSFGGVAYLELKKSNGEILKVIHGE
ncbi:NTF2 fold immunity protein [uncultured Bacteroides sp.]|uniref:NTF2 fold immunity protein n=1 Tax=uncultured Bacteroides sp. TaxID=162156 RepID=UPI002AA78FA0|nr:NTF2 fold immunity protein [uncultured Bacteroides sp.]